MNKLEHKYFAVAAAIFMLSACEKPQEKPMLSKSFDARAIAAEADKGNLMPLQDLNKACTEEVEKKGGRSTVCAVQDEVGRLTKPLSIRF
jgi:hypothetical protein